MNPRKLLGQGTIYLAMLVLQRGIQVFLLPFATRQLPKSDLGILGVAVTLSAGIAIIATGGLSYAVLRLTGEERPEAGSVSKAQTLVVVQGMVGLLVGALLWKSGPAWSGLLNNIEWGPALKMTVVFGVASAFLMTSVSVLRAKERAELVLLVTVVQFAVGFPLAILGTEREGAAGYLGGLAIAAVVAAILSLVLGLDSIRLHSQTIRHGLIIALPFAVHWLATWVIAGAGRVIAERVLDLEQAGAFYVASAVGALPALMVDAAQSAWTPAVYGRSTGVEIRSAALAKVLISGISAAILLGAALTPLLLPLVYPAADRVTFMALIFVAAAALPGISAMLATSVVASYKQTAYLAGVSISGAVVAIALNFGLIEGFGMAGAGLALFGTGILSAALLVHRAASLESDRIPLATPILIGVAIIALGLVVALISTRGLVVQGFVYVMISLVALRLGIGPVRKLLGYLANTDQPQLESP